MPRVRTLVPSIPPVSLRMGPWMGGGPIVDDKPRVKQSYLDNKYKMDKYPYLYAGMRGIRDFQRKYCPKEILKRGNALACNAVPSIDDGDLVRRFEKFVRDYSGLDPFDIQCVSSFTPCMGRFRPDFFSINAYIIVHAHGGGLPLLFFSSA